MATTISERLTQDQYAVLRLLKKGFSIQEIADELGRTYYSVRHTVRTMRDRGLVTTPRNRGDRSTVNVDLRTVRPRRS